MPSCRSVSRTSGGIPGGREGRDGGFAGLRVASGESHTRRPANSQTPPMSDWLAQRAHSTPHKLAMLAHKDSWSFARLDAAVSELAGRLAAAGVEPGQRVAVLMPNRVEYVVAIHALARLGAVLVPLNTRLTADELRWQVEKAGCALILCAGSTEAQAAPLHKAERLILSVDDPSGPPVQPLATYQPLPGCPPGRAQFELGRIQAIVFTSGTTGRPKGAMLTFANHFWSATASSFRLGLDPADRWLLCLPLYHVGGLAIVLRSCLYGTAVVLQERFDPEAVSQAIDQQAVTLISLVPTMLHRLLEQRGERPFPSTLRCILLGGAAAPPTLLARCQALDLPMATTYGLTEAASQVATAPPDVVRRKPGSVGRPLMFSTVSIVGDDGQPLPAGKIGEIVVRGPMVMAGYWAEPEATARVLRAGPSSGSGERWLHTGDLGYLDEEGDLWVVQRRVDLIVSGGENVYPREVEQVLLEHPDVLEVCVVGVPDAEWGQQVAAAVVPRPGSRLTLEALRAFCRPRLAGYKLPRRLVLVERLPRTASGKVHRPGARELFDT